VMNCQLISRKFQARTNIDLAARGTCRIDYIILSNYLNANTSGILYCNREWKVLVRADVTPDVTEEPTATCLCHESA